MAPQYRIPFNKLGNNPGPILRAVERVLQSGDFILGKAVTEFEDEFAHYMNMHRAVGVGNGTDGLELALRSLNLSPGAKVMTVANAGLPLPTAIKNAGLTPVFCDVNASGLMTPELLELHMKLEDNVQAVIPVHLYGQVADIKSLAAVAGVPIIEDACQAVGTSYDFGEYSYAVVVSFYPTKVLGTLGDAGAVLSNLGGVSAEIRDMRNYGVSYRDSVSDAEFSRPAGRNSRMDSIQASILLHKLSELSIDLRIRREKSKRYFDGISKKFHHRNFSPLENQHLFTILVANREDFIELAEDRGIQLKAHYPRSVTDLKFQMTEWLCGTVVSLPLYNLMTDEEQDEVIKLVNEVAIATT